MNLSTLFFAGLAFVTGLIIYLIFKKSRKDQIPKPEELIKQTKNKIEHKGLETQIGNSKPIEKIEIQVKNHRSNEGLEIQMENPRSIGDPTAIGEPALRDSPKEYNSVEVYFGTDRNIQNIDKP